MKAKQFFIATAIICIASLFSTNRVYGYPWLSPYAYCNNNPVKYVDPDGRSTWVMNNSDGTYRVVGGDLDDKDKNIYVYSIQDGNLVRGKSVGESDLMTSFYNSDANDGKGAWAIGSTIDPNDNSGMDFLSSFNNAEPAITDYMSNATEGGTYDFKNIGATTNDPIYYYRGMPISTENGKTIYSSARDIGNYTAGYIAGRHQVPWSMARIVFDGLESMQQRHSAVEGFSTQNAQLRGWSVGKTNSFSSFENSWKTIRWMNKSANAVFNRYFLK